MRQKKYFIFLFSIISLIINNNETPAQVVGSVYNSVDVKFPSGKFQLEGTVYLPNKITKMPCAIFVNGSGPGDRDGIIRQKPDAVPPIYKNWANYLSSNQIATFRYDKRFLTYPTLNPLELSQEDQINDIIAAIAYIKSRPEVDSTKIFIIGHSEGGNIAPIAAGRVNNVSGVIIVSATAFAIDTLVIEQLKANNNNPRDWVTKTEDAFSLLRNNQFPKGGQIWGGGEVYWREWIEYSEKALDIVITLKKPVLIQQGLADENFPSTMLQKNIKLWEGITKQSQLIAFKKYENVTHLILDKDTQEMSQTVLNDIISWINQH